MFECCWNVISSGYVRTTSVKSSVGLDERTPPTPTIMSLFAFFIFPLLSLSMSSPSPQHSFIDPSFDQFFLRFGSSGFRQPQPKEVDTAAEPRQQRWRRGFLSRSHHRLSSCFQSWRRTTSRTCNYLRGPCWGPAETCSSPVTASWGGGAAQSSQQ